MNRFRLNIRVKFFIAISATALLVIAMIAGLSGWSYRKGFTQYMLEADIKQLRPVIEALARDYDKDSRGWPPFQDEPHEFFLYVRDILFSIQLSRLPALGQTNELELEGPIPPPKDRRRFGPRMFLLDIDHNQIAGRHGPIAGALIEPIVSDDTDEAVVGYFGIRSHILNNEEADAIFLGNQLKALLLSVVVAILASWLVAFFFARQLTRPLKMLVKSTRVLADGDYGLRLHTKRRDEVGEIIQDLNSLAQNLDRTSKAEKQWLSDTSHELKTPLSVLRAEIEALQDGVRKAEKGTYSTLQAAIARISDLVDTLSLISNTQDGKFVHQVENQNFSQLCLDTIKMNRSVTADAGLSISERIEPGLITDADPVRIQQMIGNFLENSRRYTDAPGNIQITLARDNGDLLLVVSDSAPSPPSEALEHLFDRFYQPDKSRSLALGGTGLGLAVCHAIAEGHGGTISAETSEAGGLRIAVTIPFIGKHLASKKEAFQLDIVNKQMRSGPSEDPPNTADKVA